MITHTRGVLLFVLALGIVYSGFQLPGLRPVMAQEDICHCRADGPGDAWCQEDMEPGWICSEEKPCTGNEWCEESEASCNGTCRISIPE